MEKKIAFSNVETVVNISFNSKNYFSLSADLYGLTFTSKEELEERVQEDIENNLGAFVDDLQEKSIGELVEQRVNEIMNHPSYYNDNISGDTKGDKMITMELIACGQCLNDLLELYPNNKDIKELVNLWNKYQLKENVSQAIIDRVNVLLDRLDSKKDEYDLSDELVEHFVSAL